MQFEYLTLSCTPPELQDLLNTHARDGWRLVSSFAPSNTSKPVIVAVMERPFVQQPEGDEPRAIGMRG